MDAQNPLKELKFDTLATLREAKDRNVSLRFGVYNGTPSMTVWAGDRQPTVRQSLSGDLREVFISMFTKLISAAPNTRWSGNFQKWNEQTKKNDPTDTVIWGIDEKDGAFIGIKTTQHTWKFPIRLGLKIDLSSANLSKRETNAIALNALIEVFKYQMSIAMMMSSFPRNNNWKGGNGGGGNGQRGQYNNNANRGNGGGAGGGGNRGGNYGGSSDKAPAADEDIDVGEDIMAY